MRPLSRLNPLNTERKEAHQGPSNKHDHLTLTDTQLNNPPKKTETLTQEGEEAVDTQENTMKKDRDSIRKVMKERDNTKKGTENNNMNKKVNNTILAIDQEVPTEVAEEEEDTIEAEVMVVMKVSKWCTDQRTSQLRKMQSQLKVKVKNCNTTMVTVATLVTIKASLERTITHLIGRVALAGVMK